MWESASRMISWPGWVCARTEVRLPWVPEDTNSAASFPVRRAACSSSRRTVGSSSQTSSPTSAWAMASRMTDVGTVRVSDRRSRPSCMELPRRGSDALGRSTAPLGVPVVVRQPPEGLLGLGISPVRRVDLGQPVHRLGNDQGAGVVLDHALEALARGDRVALVQVVACHPQLLLGQPAPADVDLGQGIRSIAALGVLPHERLQGVHRLLGDHLILFDRLHLVVIAHRQPVLRQVGDLMPRVEREEDLELLDGLVPLALPIVRLPQEEPRPRRIDRLGVALDDLLKRRPRLGVAPLAQLALTGGVEIARGEERLGLLAHPIDELRAASQEGEGRRQDRENREGFEAHLQEIRFQSGVVLRGGSWKVKDIATLRGLRVAPGAHPARRWRRTSITPGRMDSAMIAKITSVKLARTTGMFPKR